MAALDLSAYAPVEEHPDVTALKANVVRVMKKYTDQHGWCDEARRAMVEAGVIDDRIDAQLRIKVTLKQGFECTPLLSVKDLLGKEEEAQKRAVAAAIGSLTIAATGLGVIGALPVSGDDIADMTLLAAPESGWRKATENSRVLHFFSAEVLGYAGAGRRTWVYPACGIEGQAYVVRQEDVGSITRRCAHCERDLGNA